MIFSLSFLTLTPNIPLQGELMKPVTHIFLFIISDFYFLSDKNLYSNLYSNLFFKYPYFQMANFNLLRTKLIMKIIGLLIVVFPWHHIWRGSISDVLFRVLSVANGNSPRFLPPLPLTSNLRAFALAVSCAWNALPSPLCLTGFFSLLKSSGMSFHREVFSEGPF